MKVRDAFRYTFGPGAGGYSVDVPAGAPCDWHAANAVHYVRPSALPIWARHDAEYRGVRVDPGNVAEDS